jgi:hypothetical protein
MNIEYKKNDINWSSVPLILLIYEAKSNVWLLKLKLRIALLVYVWTQIQNNCQAIILQTELSYMSDIFWNDWRSDSLKSKSCCYAWERYFRDILKKHYESYWYQKVLTFCSFCFNTAKPKTQRLTSEHKYFCELKLMSNKKVVSAERLNFIHFI